MQHHNGVLFECNLLQAKKQYSFARRTHREWDNAAEVAAAAKKKAEKLCISVLVHLPPP